MKFGHEEELLGRIQFAHDKLVLMPNGVNVEELIDEYEDIFRDCQEKPHLIDKIIESLNYSERAIGFVLQFTDRLEEKNLRSCNGVSETKDKYYFVNTGKYEIYRELTGWNFLRYNFLPDDLDDDLSE